MNRIDFEGHPVHYVRAGRGEPMVFLHNGGSSHRIWTSQIEHFSKTHDVLALDMLGFGSSAKPRTEYSVPLYVAVLRQFVHELDLERVTLVGNCMGSATAVHYAMREPERVRGVVAINILTRATVLAGYSGPLVRLALLSGRAARAMGTLPATPVMAKAIVAAQLADRIPSEILEHLRERYRDPDQLRVLMSIAANMNDFAALDALSGLPSGLRVLVLWGENNRILPAKAGRKLCASLNPTRALTVAGGHLPMLEHPEAVNAAIASFLSMPT
ncbi:alpha/beta hydrolase [Pendulispora rubella]|uniref:Alpha/beta hydrolase n=1 Tax=Pendulispora rubella TaxID=2741070 RepID=A0ABZ2LAK4_9BACT